MRIERIALYVIGALLFGSIFLVTDCSMGTTEQVRAEVIGKEYEPERRWTTIQYTTVGETRVPRTVNHYDDPDWLITMQGYDRDGDLQTKTIDLNDPMKFENTKIGEVVYFDISRGKFTGWKY